MYCLPQDALRVLDGFHRKNARNARWDVQEACGLCFVRRPCDIGGFHTNPCDVCLRPAGLYSPVFPRAAAEAFAARKVTALTSKNPWNEPPADVMEKGMANAAGFLKDLEDYGRTSSNRLKIVLVGLGNAGKTSIAARLDALDPDSLPTKEERTVGVEIRDVKLGPGQASGASAKYGELDVTLWDFAGQRAYYDTHQVGEVRV